MKGSVQTAPILASFDRSSLGNPLSWLTPDADASSMAADAGQAANRLATGALVQASIQTALFGTQMPTLAVLASAVSETHLVDNDSDCPGSIRDGSLAVEPHGADLVFAVLGTRGHRHSTSLAASRLEANAPRDSSPGGRNGRTGASAQLAGENAESDVGVSGLSAVGVLGWFAAKNTAQHEDDYRRTQSVRRRLRDSGKIAESST